MPWTPDILIPLDPDEPRGIDRHDVSGDRLRLRLNREGGKIVDFVVQYETPVDDQNGPTHAVVVRSDGTHEPHYDRYDARGNKSTVALPAYLKPDETINRAIEDIKRDWRSMRERYFGGWQ